MKKEKTILFLHGFYASGHCVPAVATSHSTLMMPSGSSATSVTRRSQMFFEQIERDGKRFSRFQEIDWEE